MPPAIVLDAGPLGLAAQRVGKSIQADACQQWLRDLIANGRRVYVPEVADYEVRRELVRAGQVAGVNRLDRMLTTVSYLPITTAVMHLAADLWALARNGGWATADPHALDGDVILAAQALNLGLPAGEIIVATVNVRHISRYLAADRWENITP